MADIDSLSRGLSLHPSILSVYPFPSYIDISSALTDCHVDKLGATLPFNLNPNVEPNPNPRDQTYDIMFDEAVGFDVKGTVIPRSFRSDAESCISNPQRMIEFYYDKQSTGVRHCFQNRLFIVHHSFIEPEREFILRCAWGSKEKIYRIFSENFSNINFRECHGCKAGVIFILERERGKVSFSIDGINL